MALPLLSFIKSKTIYLADFFNFSLFLKILNCNSVVIILILFIFSALLLSISCSSDDDTPIPNEGEVITKLTYTLISQSDALDIVEFTYEDSDGEGGNPATIKDGSTLKSSTTYNGTVKVENTMDTLSIIDITEEVLKEAEDHQFFYQEDEDNLTISYNDEDENGKSIGIKTILKTGSSGSGSLTITLIHKPNKEAEGIQINNMNNVGGSTDVQARFNLVISDR